MTMVKQENCNGKTREIRWQNKRIIVAKQENYDGKTRDILMVKQEILH